MCPLKQIFYNQALLSFIPLILLSHFGLHKNANLTLEISSN